MLSVFLRNADEVVSRPVFSAYQRYGKQLHICNTACSILVPVVVNMRANNPRALKTSDASLNPATPIQLHYWIDDLWKHVDCSWKVLLVNLKTWQTRCVHHKPVKHTRANLCYIYIPADRETPCAKLTVTLHGIILVFNYAYVMAAMCILCSCKATAVHVPKE